VAKLAACFTNLLHPRAAGEFLSAESIIFCSFKNFVVACVSIRVQEFDPRHAKEPQKTEQDFEQLVARRSHLFRNHLSQRHEKESASHICVLFCACSNVIALDPTTLKIDSKSEGQCVTTTTEPSSCTTLKACQALDPGTVLQLRKNLYGLKRAPRAWWTKLTSTFEALGFTACKNYPCILTHASVRCWQ